MRVFERYSIEEDEINFLEKQADIISLSIEIDLMSMKSIGLVAQYGRG